MNTSFSTTLRLTLLSILLTGLGVLTVTQRTMQLWFVLFALLSLYFLIRCRRNIRRMDILLGLVFALASMVSHPVMGFFVLPGYIASAAQMRTACHPLVLVRSDKKNELWKTAGWILGIGILLGIFNLHLGLGHFPLAPSFRWIFIFDALRAGFFEEILFRALLYALCVEVAGKSKLNRTQTGLCLWIMIIPHVLIHFSGSIDVGSLILMAVAFGLPFALLQWKVNLSSAIGAHAVVDLIRFLAFGS